MEYWIWNVCAVRREVEEFPSVEMKLHRAVLRTSVERQKAE